MKSFSQLSHWFVVSMLPLLVFTGGCKPDRAPRPTQLSQTAASAVVTASAQPAVSDSNATPVVRTAVRIKAGSSTPLTDSKGRVWLADTGFNGGDIVERADLVITNTEEPEIYRSEHYSMDSFTWPLANEKYLVKMYFCETFEGISGRGQRVFSFSVQGQGFKDFDVWEKAGGPNRAYIETVPVAITNGVLQINFTGNIENPQINAIEILPQP